MYNSKYTHFSIPITVFGILFVAASGSALHFTFEWSGYSPWAATFCSVNESTWEHLKLLFFPTITFTILEYFLQGKRLPGFLFSRAIALMLSMAFIIIVFYTYSGILGKNYPAADIGIFVISVILTFILTVKFQKMRRSKPAHSAMAIFIFIVFAILFFIFTFYPPHIGLFMDPVQKTYGYLSAKSS